MQNLGTDSSANSSSSAAPTNLSIECPADQTTGVGTEIYPLPTSVEGCDDGCVLWVNGQGIKWGDYKGEGIKVPASSEIGEQTIAVKIAPKNQQSTTKECSFKVTYAALPPKITCPASMTNMKVGSSVAVLPAAIEGCGLGCEYELSGGSSNLSGDSYKGEALDLAPESAEANISYTFNVKNTEGNESCSFTIDYKNDGIEAKRVTFEETKGKELKEGIYTITGCGQNNDTGKKTTSFGAGSSDECLSWITSETVDWNSGSKWGTCNGQFNVTFPFTIVVPKDGSVTVGDGCW